MLESAKKKLPSFLDQLSERYQPLRVFKLLFWPNDLSHCGQLYFLIPVWICLCLKRLLLLVNVFGHTSQENCWDIFYNLAFSVWRPFHIDVIHIEKNWITWPLSLFLPKKKNFSFHLNYSCIWIRKIFPFSCYPLVLWQSFQFFNPITWFQRSWPI